MAVNSGEKEKVWDALIVGAGISGLSARRVLLDAGLDVLTLEKSRGLGGRMATRRWSGPQGESLADIGAQFVSVRGEPFKHLLQREKPSRVKEIRIPGLSSHPRFVHSQGMSALAKACIGTSQDPERGPILKLTRVTSVNQNAETIWEVGCDENRSFKTRAVILSAPLPQALELITRSQLADKDDISRALASCSFTPCLAAIFPLSTDSEDTEFLIPAPGILKNVSETIEGIFDQQQKGLSSASPSIVVHASAAASRRLWERTETEILSELWEETLRAVPQHLAKTGPRNLPSSASLHKWRYCEPESPLPLPFYAAKGLLFFVGDAFAGSAGGRSRVEGAFESGRRAGLALRDELGKEDLTQTALHPAVKSALLSEVQAIAIYEAECFLLRRSAFTHARRRTLKICEEILREEREHSASLVSDPRSRDFPRKPQGAAMAFSRWGGYALGCILAALPASLSWRAHSWAEKEAAQIYEDTHERLLRESAGSVDPKLLSALKLAMQQEREHAVRFESLLKQSKNNFSESL
jgi:predicted NAD/FAD-dependent oxidoreductase